VIDCSRYLIRLSFDQCLFISLSLNCLLSLEHWLIDFQLHEWKSFALKYFQHLWGKWSWDFFLENLSMLFVLWAVVWGIRFDAHTQLWSYDWSSFDSIFWALTNVLFDWIGDFTCFDLNFQLDMIFLSLELLWTSNKLVGGCDKCMKMHLNCS